MEMSCVDVSPVDLPPAQMQVLPLVPDSLQQLNITDSPSAYLGVNVTTNLSDAQVNSSSSSSSTSSFLLPEQADRNHNTLNLNYNLPTKPPRNPTAEYIEKLWAEHFSK